MTDGFGEGAGPTPDRPDPGTAGYGGPAVGGEHEGPAVEGGPDDPGSAADPAHGGSAPDLGLGSDGADGDDGGAGGAGRHEDCEAFDAA